MDCFEVMYVLMRNKLIDPQFSIPLTNVLARDSVFATAFPLSYCLSPGLPSDAAFRGLKNL